jgi:tetratricopeptide (TPR) repeat protein
VHDYRYKLAVTLVNLTNLIKSSDSETRLRRAIDLLSKLTDDYPLILRYQYELANAYNSLAELNARVGKISDAGQNWDAARDHCAALVKANPNHHEYQSLLGVVLGGQAWTAKGQNEFPRARKLVQEAISHQKSAIRLNPKNSAYRARLSAHERFLQTEIEPQLPKADASVP